MLVFVFLYEMFFTDFHQITLCRVLEDFLFAEFLDRLQMKTK